MKRRLWVCAVLLFIGSGSSVASLDGAASIVVIPLVAQTPSYSSQVTVRNPTDSTLSVSVFFAGGTGTVSAGPHTCTPLSVPANGSVQFNVGTQCGLSPASSHFGRITLVETSDTPISFQAYSRTQTPGGNGFSVPAFPAGALEAPTNGHYALGLKRQSAVPTYQTNCFVSATDEASSYSLRLLNASGAQLGATLSGSLAANQMIRFLDIFAAVGLPPGDYSNVTAEFTSASLSGFIGFCTVQESTFFGADFRIAQPVFPLDASRDRNIVVPPSGGGFFSFTAYINMNRHEFTLRQPDFVRCLVISVFNVLEIRLKSPTGVVVGGGTGVWDTGKVYTGPRSVNGGYSGTWTVDVAAMPTYFGPFPVDYFLVCTSGNGGLITTVYQTLIADF